MLVGLASTPRGSDSRILSAFQRNRSMTCWQPCKDQQKRGEPPKLGGFLRLFEPEGTPPVLAGADARRRTLVQSQFG